MDLKGKWAFLRDKALPCMAEATFPYVASIFGVHAPKTGEHEGTALRCVVSGRRCLITALHVLEAASKYPAGIAVSAGFGMPPRWIEGPINYDRIADVAVYFLPNDYPDDPNLVRFWPEDRVEPSSSLRSTDYLFVHGFPCALSGPVPLGVANRSFPYGAMEMLESDGLPSTLEPGHFGIHFGAQAMMPQVPEWVTNPEGLSGSPVWRLGLSGRSAETWSPEDCRLVGFVIKHWDGPELGGKSFLEASEAGKLLEIGREALPLIRS